MVNDHEAELVAEACRELGEPVGFKAPTGYPDSLALCILDSVWSLGVNYDNHVVPVLDRWREHARDLGIDTEAASAADLVTSVNEAGGSEAFADDVACNHQRTSSKNGIPKAEAIVLCAQALVDTGINTTEDLRQKAQDGELASAKKAWRAVPGQRSSAIGWHYLLILANVDDVKPDRMLTRFVDRAIGRSTESSEEVRDLVLAAHKLLVNADGQPTIRALDHEIWSRQRGR